MQVAAIIAAGGRGVRFGADRPKQFFDIGGRSILELSVAALAASDRIQEIVVALPKDHVDSGAKALRQALGRPISVVAGGARRQDSVANAFAKASKDADIVLIHDAARPFVTRDVIDRAINGAERHGAAIAAIGVRDTVKQAGDASADGSRLIRATIPRDSVFLAQTPQAFRRDILARALDEGKDVDATDEAMLVERLGVPVHVVEGDERNVKITTADDLAKAKIVWRASLEPPPSNRPRRHRIRPASSCWRPSVDSRRRHDSVRAWSRRSFGRRHRLSRRHGRDPRRRRRRRHWPVVSGHRSAMERRE
jgi:2-C-methyl-D-erythritol 4-phosphate cytidylyltransferase